jgi:hypothetical protein
MFERSLADNTPCDRRTFVGAPCQARANGRACGCSARVRRQALLSLEIRRGSVPGWTLDSPIREFRKWMSHTHRRSESGIWLESWRDFPSYASSSNSDHSRCVGAALIRARASASFMASTTLSYSTLLQPSAVANAWTNSANGPSPAPGFDPVLF